MVMHKNYHEGLHGWFDVTSTPTWSNFVDMHVSAVLILILAVAARSGHGARRAPRVLVGGLLLACGARLATWLGDPACHRFSCIDHPNSILLGAGEPLASELVSHWGMPRLPEKPCACAARTGCDATGPDAVRRFTNVYVPTHARAAPFFVGALLACSYVGACQGLARARAAEVTNGAARRRAWARRGRMLLALIWAAERHGLLLLARVPGPFAASLPEALFELFGGLFDCAAWACMLFAAFVPEAHPAHSRLLARTLSWPCLRGPAKLTFGMYCLHWVVVFDFLRFAPRDWLPDNAIALFLVAFATILTLTCALAWTVHHFIEVPSVCLARRVAGKAPPANRVKAV
uniref:Uncharacterized protein n=1 Tax=Zooxanthella nutricula TaxID=1333877 RepID=A0A7S2K848_9DINO